MGLDLPETYVAPDRHHAKKNLLCLRYLLIKKFVMSDMCLAGKNKKGWKIFTVDAYYILRYKQTNRQTDKHTDIVLLCIIDRSIQLTIINSSRTIMFLTINLISPIHQIAQDEIFFSQ